MTKADIIHASDFIIKTGFVLLFFLVPLFFTPFNFELFEYNKIMLTYALTAIILGTFLIKSRLAGKLLFTKTPFDLPIFVFLASQIVSTVISIDRHTSFWGYYSRFHGGLLSTITYIILYYIYVAQFSKNPKFFKISLYTSMISGLFVSVYAITQHFGIDKQIWIQDVQNRVFSTLGQPNWLAAYLSVLIIILFGFFINTKGIRRFLYLSLSLLFYLTLIFTKSRSGFIGLFTGLGIVYLILLLKNRNTALKYIFSRSILSSSLFIFPLLLILISFFYGTPFSQLERFTFKNILQKYSAAVTPPTPATPARETITAIEYGGTESGIIRKIVWKGALDIFKHHPLFGTGVETFAYSYYKYRPREHNLTSEWDFLYNKAHNELLNFAANSGIFGLSSYLLLIIFISKYMTVRINLNKEDSILQTAFLGAFVTIPVGSFWGFSTVVTGIFFFLLPALSITAGATLEKPAKSKEKAEIAVSFSDKTVILAVMLAVIYIIVMLGQMWRADAVFNYGNQLSRSNQYINAYQQFKKAVKINPAEALYQEQLAISAATLSVLANQQDQKELAVSLKQEADSLSDKISRDHPYNLNFIKSRTRVLYTLSEFDPQLYQNALQTLQQAWELAPNDIKIVYNIGLLYGKLDKVDSAIEMLNKAVSLKPDYYEPHFALALFYEQLGQNDKAIEELTIIITTIRPDDPISSEKLKQLKK